MTSLINVVATEVAREFGSRPSSILAPTRGRAEDARARAIAMYVWANIHAEGSCFTAVGRAFNRDRTTVRHAQARVRDWTRDESGFKRRLRNVLGRVKARA